MLRIATILLCLTVLVLPSTVLAAQQDKLISNETKQAEPNTIGGKQWYSLGFKGIHLGMTRDEVEEVVNSENGLSFKYGNAVGSTEEYSFLNSASPIGCKGDGETEICYSIDSVSVRFYEDHAICISIQSPSYSADGIHPYVKEWARFSLPILRKKYGNPTKKNLNIDNFNVFSVQSGYSLPLYIWDKKNESVELSIGSYKFEYYAEIDYCNKKALAKIKKEMKKVKSEL